MIADKRPHYYKQVTYQNPEQQRQQYDAQIAKAAVKEVFALLGVDVDDPEKVEEFRKDLRFGGAMRRATDRGVMAMMWAICTMIGTALCLGVVALAKANKLLGT